MVITHKLRAHASVFVHVFRAAVCFRLLASKHSKKLSSAKVSLIVTYLDIKDGSTLVGKGSTPIVYMQCLFF